MCLARDGQSDPRCVLLHPRYIIHLRCVIGHPGLVTLDALSGNLGNTLVTHEVSTLALGTVPGQTTRPSREYYYYYYSTREVSTGWGMLYPRGVNGVRSRFGPRDPTTLRMTVDVPGTGTLGVRGPGGPRPTLLIREAESCRTRLDDGTRGVSRRGHPPSSRRLQTRGCPIIINSRVINSRVITSVPEVRRPGVGLLSNSVQLDRLFVLEDE